MTFGAALLDTLPQAAILWVAVLLLSLATIKVTAQWKSREKEANGRGANRSSAYDLTPAVSEGGAQPSKTPVRGLTKGEAPDAVIPVVDLTRSHGRNAGQTGSQAPAVPLASSSRLTREVLYAAGAGKAGPLPFVPARHGAGGNRKEALSFCEIPPVTTPGQGRGFLAVPGFAVNW